MADLHFIIIYHHRKVIQRRFNASGNYEISKQGHVKFNFTANGRAIANDTTEGFAKIIADAKTDKVLGAHIIGPEAGNLIAELVLAMEFGASSEDIARTCHSHPTLTEAVRQAAMGVEGWTMQM